MLAVKSGALSRECVCFTLNIFFLLFVLVYFTVGAQQVATIAIGDIQYSESEGGLDSQASVVTDFARDLEAALENTRKFRVLDNSQLRQRLNKQGIMLKTFYDKAHRDHVVFQRGLDYILSAEIKKFSFLEKKLGIETNLTGFVEIDFKALPIADGTKELKSTVSVKASKGYAGETSSNADEVMQLAMAKAVKQLNHQLISTVYPIRIMKISEEGLITLNYGEGVLEAGDAVLVYPKEEAFEFSADGKPIANSIATLRVITSATKFADVQALDGFERLTKGQKVQLLFSAD